MGDIGLDCSQTLSATFYFLPIANNKVGVKEGTYTGVVAGGGWVETKAGPKIFFDGTAKEGLEVLGYAYGMFSGTMAGPLPMAPDPATGYSTVLDLMSVDSVDMNEVMVAGSMSMKGEFMGTGGF